MAAPVGRPKAYIIGRPRAGAGHTRLPFDEREVTEETSVETIHFPTQSTAEAMAVLKHARKAQIALARAIAVELIQHHGTTHTREVRDTMIARGVFNRAVPEYWLGAIFRDQQFVFTGQFFDAPSKEGDEEQNTHARNIVKVWTLKEGHH